MKLFESFREIHEFYNSLPEWVVDYTEIAGYESAEITKPIGFLNLAEEIDGKNLKIEKIRITEDTIDFIIGEHTLKLAEIKSINKAIIAKYMKMSIFLDDATLEINNYLNLENDDNFDPYQSEYYLDIVYEKDYWIDRIEAFIKGINT